MAFMFLKMHKRLFGVEAKIVEGNHVRKELARVRATAMEGSFGRQKEHYDLRRTRPGRSRWKSCHLLLHTHGKSGAAGGQD